MKIFQISKRDNHNLFLMECKFKLYVPLFSPLKIKNNIQQVGLEYGIVSQIEDIEI